MQRDEALKQQRLGDDTDQMLLGPVSPPARRALRLEAPRSWQMLNLAELRDYRELLFFFVWRDVKVRYKQTVLGALWAVIQPLATTFFFALLFGRFGGMARQVSGPYALHVFVGMMPWTFFSNAVVLAANSLVGSSHLITKVYFPRILVPAAAVASSLVDFAISFLVLAIMMALYGVAPTWQLVVMPLFVAGTIVAATGAGVFFAALIVTYRDVRYALTFLMQLWLFGSPVLYTLEIIPAHYRLWYAINPLAGLIGGFRSSILGAPFPLAVIAVSTVTTLLLAAVGVRYFLQVERRFADVI
ncbi:MAG TPA: ABC transporter permease [Vicinamibacterales bacterium]|nr:ABC transporter permease [Vicinamibacterales bacterium]